MTYSSDLSMTLKPTMIHIIVVFPHLFVDWHDIWYWCYLLLLIFVVDPTVLLLLIYLTSIIDVSIRWPIGIYIRLLLFELICYLLTDDPLMTIVDDNLIDYYWWYSSWLTLLLCWPFDLLLQKAIHIPHCYFGDDWWWHSLTWWWLLVLCWPPDWLLWPNCVDICHLLTLIIYWLMSSDPCVQWPHTFTLLTDYLFIIYWHLTDDIVLTLLTSDPLLKVLQPVLQYYDIVGPQPWLPMIFIIDIVDVIVVWIWYLYLTFIDICCWRWQYLLKYCDTYLLLWHTIPQFVDYTNDLTLLFDEGCWWFILFYTIYIPDLLLLFCWYSFPVSVVICIILPVTLIICWWPDYICYLLSHIHLHLFDVGIVVFVYLLLLLLSHDPTLICDDTFGICCWHSHVATTLICWFDDRPRYLLINLFWHCWWWRIRCYLVLHWFVIYLFVVTFIVVDMTLLLLLVYLLYIVVDVIVIGIYLTFIQYLLTPPTSHLFTMICVDFVVVIRCWPHCCCCVDASPDCWCWRRPR